MKLTRILSTLAVAALATLSSTSTAAPGDLDLTFGGTGKVIANFGGSGQSVAIQSDGKIVVAGYSATNTPFGYNFAVARYNADGSLDTSFNHTGKLTTNFGPTYNQAQSVAVQDDGKIVVAGYAGNNPFDEVLAVARFNTDGSLDTSFNGGGKAFTNAGNLSARGQSVAIQSDGKIVVAGSSLRSNPSNYDFALVRFNLNGSIDFQGSIAIGTSNDYGSSVAIRNDGTIVVAGYTFKGSSEDFALTSGSGKVSTNVGGFDDRAYGIAIQGDGKFVVAGYSNNGSDNDFALLRYNADLSPDTSFGDGGIVTTDFGGSDDIGYGIALQNDGMIVIAGTSNAHFAVARYNGGIAVPEPSTVTLLILSIATLFGASRRCRPVRTANGSHIWFR